MRKAILKLTFTFLILLLFVSCHKDDKVFNTGFYVTWSASEAPMKLFIDGKYKGDLPFIPVKPSCENDSLKKLTLILDLKSGKYKIEAKDQKDIVRSSGTIKLSSSKLSTSGSVGGQDVNVVGECAIIGFT